MGAAALFGWDPADVTAVATVALGVLAAGSIIANALLVRAAVRQAGATETAAKAAADAVHAQEQQVALARDELLLVERQVAVMERQAALQESADARRVRLAFPHLEVESTSLGPQEIKGTIHYIAGDDPADAVEVWIWFRGRQYLSRVGRIYPSVRSTGFTAVPVDMTSTSSAAIPSWALSRGSRVDAISWMGASREGLWWAQRYGDDQRPLGLPDRGAWNAPGPEPDPGQS